MKLKALMAGVLAAASILSLTACDESAPVNSGNGTSDAPGATTPATTTTHETFADNEGVNSAVQEITDKLDLSEVEVGDRKIKWLGWWPIDETTAEVKLFKNAYGVPDEQQLFEYIQVTDYAQAYDLLGTMISSGDSPDLFPFELQAFPARYTKNVFQPIDDIVDLSNSKWDGVRELNDQFSLGGKHYCAFFELDVNQFLYYQTSVVDSAGLDDPRELFEAGNWNWDTFLDMGRKFQLSGDNKYLIDGYVVDSELVATTGVPLVALENQRLVSNLHNPDIERAMTDLIDVMQRENLRHPDAQANTALWVDGDVLFYCHGSAWAWQDTLRNFAKRGKIDAEGVKFVPLPKDPKADKYYVNGKPYTTLWVTGSENGDLVGAWIDACMTAALDPDVKAAGKAQRKENYMWTDENLDYVYKFTSAGTDNPLTTSLNFINGLGTTVYDKGWGGEIAIDITRIPYLTAENSYTQLRDMYENTINAAIEETNAKFASFE